MFCKRCGTKVDDDALFCENCGTAVKRPEQPAAEKAPEPEVETAAAEVTAAQPAQAAAAQAPEQPVQPQAQSAQTEKKALPKWVYAAAGAVLVLVIALLLLGGGGGGSDSFYHDMNYNNVGFFAYDSNRLYFMAEYDDDDSGKKLYSTDYKGINKQLISDNSKITRIRVVDGKLYYYESGSDEYNIGVMDKDGSNERTIVSCESSVSKFAVQGDRLYYQTDGELYSCNLDGEDEKKLLDDISSFVLGKNAVYYVKDDVVSVFDLKKEQSRELCKGEGAVNLALNKSSLYFKDGKGLACVDVKGDGSVTRLIDDSRMGNYVFWGDHIYYVSMFETEEIEELAELLGDSKSEILSFKLLLIGTGEIYKANLDGSDVHKLDEEGFASAFTLYTCPESIYYKVSAFANEIKPLELN